MRGLQMNSGGFGGSAALFFGGSGSPALFQAEDPDISFCRYTCWLHSQPHAHSNLARACLCPCAHPAFGRNLPPPPPRSCAGASNLPCNFSECENPMLQTCVEHEDSVTSIQPGTTHPVTFGNSNSSKNRSSGRSDQSSDSTMTDCCLRVRRLFSSNCWLVSQQFLNHSDTIK